MQTSQIITTIGLTVIISWMVLIVCIVSSCRTTLHVIRTIEENNYPLKIKRPEVYTIKLAHLWQFGVVILFLVFYGMIVAKLGT